METNFINNTVLDADKYLVFNQFHYTANKWNKVWFATYLLTGIFMFISCLALTLRGEMQFLSYSFMGLLLILVAFFPKIRIKWWFRRFIRTEKRLPMEIEYRFGPVAFEAKTLHSSEEVLYSQLYKIVETDRFYYFYINKINAYIVDKSGFAADTAASFSDFLRNTAGQLYTDRTKKQSR